MSKIDTTYHNLLNEILEKGYWYDDPKRQSVKRLEIPSYTFRHEFKDGFPAITTKKLSYKNVTTELIWFLRGDTNIKYLIDNGCNIWNKDAYNHYCKWFLKKYPDSKQNLFTIDEFISIIKRDILKELNNPQDISKRYSLGDLGPIYGQQWRRQGDNRAYEDGYHDIVDQISNLIKNLKEQPLATDHIVNSWNVGDLPDMALPPCHYGFQIVVRPLSVDERLEVYNKIPRNKKASLSCEKFYCSEEEYHEELNDYVTQYGFELHWTQRSVDTFLGLPYNIASYATLAQIISKLTGYKMLAIQGDLKKVHLYDNSLDAVKEQLSRDVNKYESSKLEIHIDEEIKMFDDNIDKIINNFTDIEHFYTLENYESYPTIKVEMLERND